MCAAISGNQQAFVQQTSNPHKNHMNTKSIALAAVCAAAALASTGGIAWAHNSLESSKAGELNTLVEQANLVATGSVTEVRYVNAMDPETGALVPHAFVTYRLEKVLRGKTASDTLTLRFIGGPDGQGRFLAVNGVPMFQEGERDVLFVAGNGEQGCPLVRCGYGRFRVLGDRVYNTHGSPLLAIIKNNTVSRGLPPLPFQRFSFPAPAFDNLMKNPEARKLLEKQGLNYDEAKKRYELEAPRKVVLGDAFDEVPAQTGRDGGGQPGVTLPQAVETQRKPQESAISLDQFLTVVDRLTRESRRAPQPLLSIDPKAPIKLTPFRAVAPIRPLTAIELREPVPANAGPEEAAERKALTNNNFNPVLPR